MPDGIRIEEIEYILGHFFPGLDGSVRDAHLIVDANEYLAQFVLNPGSIPKPTIEEVEAFLPETRERFKAERAERRIAEEYTLTKFIVLVAKAGMGDSAARQAVLEIIQLYEKEP